MLRVISERNLDKEKLSAFFIDGQTFEHDKWNKLIQILNENGNNWPARTFISKLYMVQCNKLRFD